MKVRRQVTSCQIDNIIYAMTTSFPGNSNQNAVDFR